MTLNIWTLVAILIISTIIISVPVIIRSSYLSNQKIEAAKLSVEEEVRILNVQLDSYKEEIREIVQIRDNYRSSIKEIVNLLYARDSHVGIGGAAGPSISETDEVNLLTIRNIIATMQDDQRLFSEVKNYLEARKNFIESFPFIWPVVTNGVPHVSSGYGFRHDLFNEDGSLRLHAGIDINLREGHPVIATADGTVLWTLWDDDMGYIIVLSHRNGFTTGYSHLKEVQVNIGQVVKRGEQIGTVGNTGRSSMGSHLHYEIRQNGVSLDPMIFLSTNF